MRRAIPNLISASRLLLAIPLGLMLWASASNHAWRWGVVALFLWNSFSDWLDGYLARRFNAQSALGRLLDPAADKLLALVCFVVLVAMGWNEGYFSLPVWLVVLVVAKDLWTVIGYAVIRMMGVSMAIRPSIWGRASTFFQLVLIGSIVLGQELEKLMLGWSRDLLLWAAAVTTCLAAVNYSWTAISRLMTVQLVNGDEPVA